MTPDQIEDMRRDMEAGTPGDAWVIGGRGASIYVKGDGNPYEYAERVGGAVYEYDSGVDLEFSEADLGRICRVPQLEAEVLRLRGLLQRVEPNIGWRGAPDDDLESDLFHCEFCGASAAEVGDIPHHDECLVYLVRAALKGTDQ